MVEKTVNIEIKASLKLLFKTRKINFKYWKSYRLSAKKEKNKASQEYWDRDKDKNKAKSHNFSFANSQP